MGCLPYGMPALMLIPHNAMEILFTPGRVTILGESDGNRLRRIYTDGRSHPDDPDLTFSGHSIGHWEGQALVVDTVGVLPQSWVAISEAVGNPNDGDMHIVERIHLDGPGVLLDELTITAPKIFTAPWKTTRRWYRQRSPNTTSSKAPAPRATSAKRPTPRATPSTNPSPRAPTEDFHPADADRSRHRPGHPCTRGLS